MDAGEIVHVSVLGMQVEVVHVSVLWMQVEVGHERVLRLSRSHEDASGLSRPHVCVLCSWIK